MSANGQTTEEANGPIGNVRCFATAYSSRECLAIRLFSMFINCGRRMLLALFMNCRTVPRLGGCELEGEAHWQVPGVAALLSDPKRLLIR